MRPHIINKETHGIAGWYIDKSVCIDLIKYFENSPNKGLGLLYLECGGRGVDKKRKLSTDIPISLDNRYKAIVNYYKELTKVTKAYKKKYKYCDHQQSPWAITGDWNLQKYKPKEGYFAKHCERNGPITIYRHLVFMTYLNTIKEGGETEFYYQEISIKPKKGSLVIFPTTWTHLHRGRMPISNDKYICNLWLLRRNPIIDEMADNLMFKDHFMNKNN